MQMTGPSAMKAPSPTQRPSRVPQRSIPTRSRRLLPSASCARPRADALAKPIALWLSAMAHNGSGKPRRNGFPKRSRLWTAFMSKSISAPSQSPSTVIPLRRKNGLNVAMTNSTAAGYPACCVHCGAMPINSTKPKSACITSTAIAIACGMTDSMPSNYVHPPALSKPAAKSR